VPPPFRAPDELVTVQLIATRPARLPAEISIRNRIAAQSRSFQDLAAYQTALGRVV
jgi:hypothetical protein